ncbi:hypothetical protein [Segetibacter sp.]|uniref:hypothetical protein n=1 Tax=Segetibacter sp. TaxID=2231182 RepID=UPI00261BACE4|nr:hypothetical protein [Segetibacter sp.]MCW3080038.1 hypothetical protein [Segetibacter sp.]
MKKTLLLSIFLFLSILSIRAQVVDSMIKVYSEQVPDEKVHVHFDKDLYRAGEPIWFKAYLFSGFSLSSTSKNFYAELINDKGNIVQRKVYPIAESSASGNFDLPDSLRAGNMIFRGYTTWMLNFDTAFIFQKNIAVTDKAGLPEKGKSEVAKNYTIQFFPEGGNLVNSLQSVVAFKANDELGLPVVAKGNIVDSKGTVITSFSSAHDGMGSFSLTPAASETYQAVWTDPGGKKQTVALPETKAQGFVLKISGAAGKKVFMLTRTDDVPDSWKKVNVVALLGQERVYKAKANLTETKVTSGTIPVENLPSGLLQITVFSDTWEPIAERITMVNNANYLFDAKVSTPELNTNFRAKNTIEIEVDDTLLSNMSLAVTDAAIGRQTSGDNIISRMLLSGDIKGFVHNPTYYFANTADSTANNLDLVLLTHGWRRYNWATMARGRKPVIKFPADTYLTLEARVFGVTTASPLRTDEQLLIFIQGKDSSSQFLEMPKSGPDKFTLPNVVFYDTATVFYQFMKDKKAEREMSLGFYNNFIKGPRRIDLLNRPLNLEIDTAAIARTKFFADKLFQLGSKFDPKGNVLEAVTVRTRTKSVAQQLDEKYASGLFRGDNGYSFDLTTNNGAGNLDIFSYLQGKVAGLQITGAGSNANLQWRGSRPALFLNEMQADVSQLSSISVNDVAYIKVMRPPFIGAMGGGAGGAIAVYTKKGGDVKMEPGKGLNKSMVVGYSAPKEFYSPNYKDLSGSSQVAADFRTTLYWNPLILTDGSRKKVRVEFYNNDITKAYRVILEGVNEIGKMVRVEKVIQQQR